MTPLQRLARHLGYDLTPRKKAKPLDAQLVTLLEHFRITCVLDVGANVGQYASRLREWGYRGRIVSFEPLSGPHAALERAAAKDPAWQVAPRMALGDHDGDIEIQVSAESDMSSALPQTELLRRISPSSAVHGCEPTSLRRLDDVVAPYLRPAERVFLKIDTQGFEWRVLAGAAQLMDQIVGVQLEMSLVPCYEGEHDFRALLDHLGQAGFSPHLFLPGYFEPKLARQLQIDGVFVRQGD